MRNDPSGRGKNELATGGCRSGSVRVGLFSRVENRNSSQTAWPSPGLKARLSQRENMFAHPHPVLLRQTQSINQKPATKITEEPPEGEYGSVLITNKPMLGFEMRSIEVTAQPSGRDQTQGSASSRRDRE